MGLFKWLLGGRKIKGDDYNALVDLIELFGIKSEPPIGKKRITSIYWDPDTEEIVIDHEA